MTSRDEALRALEKVAADLDAGAKRDREAGESMYSGGIESYEADDPVGVADGLIFAAEFSEKRAAEIRQQIAILATASEQAPVADAGETNCPPHEITVNILSKDYEAGFHSGMTFEAEHRLLDSPAHTSEARDAQDAARYRWLKSGGYEHCDDEQPYIAQSKVDGWGKHYVAIVEDDEADAGIDAAMRQEAE